MVKFAIPSRIYHQVYVAIFAKLFLKNLIMSIRFCKNQSVKIIYNSEFHRYMRGYDFLSAACICEDNLQFGISSLHAWIRFFECCLHLAYKLEIKKWQGRKEDKNSVENRKKFIQKCFRQQLGLIVDQPKQGYGSSNGGNTARRFFENSTISASITRVDEDVIKRFHIILQTLSSGFEINVQKFQEYSLSTAKRFVELYPWFYMPTSVHKVLIHGHKIIESSLIPIGQMSEEAQESCNKYIKKFREDFARKCSRTKNIEDVFRRLLITSYPLISSLRKLPPKKLKSLSPQAVELLLPPSVTESSCDISQGDTSDDDNDNGSNNSPTYSSESD